MTRDEVIGKIRKLLALADGNANENEAVAAALKAQKLMAEYDVEADELVDEEKKRVPVEIETILHFSANWRGWMAQAVAENFRCMAYRTSKRVDGKRMNTMVFVGYDLDARAAAMTYEKLAEVAERCCKAHCRLVRLERGDCRGVKNAYMYGFVEGVRRELEKQSQALMLVCPKEIVEYFDNLGTVQTRKVRIDATQDDVDAGENAGRDAVRSTRLGVSDEHMLQSA